MRFDFWRRNVDAERAGRAPEPAAATTSGGAGSREPSAGPLPPLVMGTNTVRREQRVLLPGEMFGSAATAQAVCQSLPESLVGVTILADGSHTIFLGPGFIRTLVRTVCVERGGLLVIGAVDSLVGELFTEIAYALGAATQVSVTTTVPTRVAYRRPLRELTAGPQPAVAVPVDA